jgi:hypothetical protein
MLMGKSPLRHPTPPWGDLCGHVNTEFSLSSSKSPIHRPLPDPRRPSQPEQPLHPDRPNRRITRPPGPARPGLRTQEITRQVGYAGYLARAVRVPGAGVGSVCSGSCQ